MTSVEAEFVAHHLRLFGFPNATTDGNGAILVVNRPRLGDLHRLRATVATGTTIVALEPSSDLLSAVGVETEVFRGKLPVEGRCVHSDQAAWSRVRSLHAAVCFRAVDPQVQLQPVVVSAAESGLWAWLAMDRGGILLVGTDLGADLVRYRQGDPAAVADRTNSELWGIPGERPVYLFDRQLHGEQASERHADWWCWTLREALIRYAGVKAEPILPGGAPGAVVITGDDDQAYLEMYDKQRAALEGLPVTYFLHPLTKHSRGSLAKLSRGRRIELGLHPDGLDAPDRYAELFAVQAAWFEQLTGYPARTVRNHGFLNDGYWGHLPTWIAAGVVGSSNLPGLDGRVLNGSLLPARMAFDGTLTDHWSILTAIGDGVVFIQGRQGRAAGDVVRKLGRQVRDSGVPGIVVLNLHPQNIELTEDMHVAARELVQDGFVAWTMSEMIDWFRARDHAHLAGTMMQTVSVGEFDLRESERPKISQSPPFP